MLGGENITQFQDDGSDDSFDLFVPEEPVMPHQNVTRKLYSIPFEEVSFALEKDHFRITSQSKYKASIQLEDLYDCK